MIHELPTEAQLGPNGTHVRDKRLIDHTDGQINLVVEYGSLDGDGNFVPLGFNKSVPISDREAFNAANSAAEKKPDVKADPPGQMRRDVFDHLDAKGLWPGQGAT